ncbi:MAG TPA: tetratricopeptide repeat protein, partial [Alphaproteobacteria bacterium]|nr:tetratricopeptide repeat protein [Alphaproteobacteria bacterium]
ICEKILAEDADHVDALYVLGWIAFGRKDLRTALDHFQRVIKLKPDHARAHNNIGTVLMTAGNAIAAGRHLEAAVAADPNFTEAYNNLGAVRLTQNEPNAARAAFEKAAALAPNDPGTLNNLGSVKLRLGDADGAIAEFKKALSARPDLAEAHNNLANAYRRKGLLEDAVASLGRGLEAAPDSPELLCNLGVIHYELGDYEAALGDYDRALAAHSDHRRSAYMRTFPLLALGRFGEGWAAYLNRPGVRKTESGLHRQPLAADLGQTTIVLRSEGEAYEDLEFLRFVPELARRGATVRIGAASNLTALALTMDGIDSVAPEGGADGVLDVALGDLPYLLGVNAPGDLPPPARFAADASHTQSTAARLNASGKGPFIGITWRRATRSGAINVPIDRLAGALSGVQGTIVMLQQGAGSDVLGRIQAASSLPVVDFSDVLDDMLGSLSLFSLLDHYVCVPGTGLYLRQAVGREADILVPEPPDYRFAGSNPTSPWFPGCRLHRAARGADWAPALTSLSGALAQAH